MNLLLYTTSACLCISAISIFEQKKLNVPKINKNEKTLKMNKSVSNVRKSIYVLTIIPREEEVA